ncbi:MAG: 3-oxocholest-4-en-26-oate---CoA ligase [Actinomycetota bacterium]|jgi:fatty-acyl-CoA synthase|nr:3-oxocholest-4-en-26-oate---CoA ligase [Actinomycetota bacterium]
MERHLATVWEHVADAIPGETALVQGAVRRTWAEFDDRAARFAGALSEAGLRPGSKVAQYLYNSPEYLEAYYGGLKVRAIPVNVNYRYLDDELLYLLENSEAEALVFHASLGERVARVREKAKGVRLWLEVDDASAAGSSYEDALAVATPAPRIERDPNDITMTYTGGTTGMPKGVMGRIHGSIDTFLVAVPPVLGRAPLTEPEQIVDTARELAEAGQQYVSMPACPLMHGTGLGIGALPAITFGGKIVLLAGRGLDVDELWSTVEAEGVNAVTVVGDAFARPMLRGLDEGPARDLSSMRLILSAGAMFSEDIKQRLLDHMPSVAIVDYIAATEGAMGVSISTKDRPAPTGRFRPNPGVKVLTDAGDEVVPGSDDIGMVAISGTDPAGYFKDEEKTGRLIREVGGVRYVIPGDYAKVDADGSILLLGRGSQCINTGGEKVFPEEVEEVLKLHPAVEDALVFGLPDERFGQRVAAVVSIAPGQSVADPADVIEGVREKLSSYKLPRDVVVVAVVPRAPNGKADYAGARSLFEASITSAPRK